MAKVFRQSAFLFLVVGFLVLVKADPLHHDDDHSSKVIVKQKDHHDDDDHDHSSKVIVKQRDHHDHDDDDDDDHHNSKVNVRERTHFDDETGKTVVPVRERNENGCSCGDGKMKQFAQKFALILRTYGSKELRPELHRVASKFVDYVVSYLAQEKPQQMGKVNNFLQGTVKVTSSAVSKSSASY